MGLEPMTSPLPRECSTTELHQPSFELFVSSRARIFAITVRNANRPKINSGNQRTGTCRPATCNTAEPSIVNQANRPKTTKIPSATAIRPLSAAGLSDGSRSLIVNTLEVLTLYCKTGAQGRIRTSVAHSAADLQSAAINHSATCAFPLVASSRFTPITAAGAHAHDRPKLWLADTARRGQRAATTKLLSAARKNLELAKGFEPPTA
jgi:hypothetical protein